MSFFSPCAPVCRRVHARAHTRLVRVNVPRARGRRASAQWHSSLSEPVGLAVAILTRVRLQPELDDEGMAHASSDGVDVVHLQYRWMAMGFS